jgi:hypothetical protein
MLFEAAKQEDSYEEYLLGLMEKEFYTRVENRKKITDTPSRVSTEALSA